jgi:imidazole glycerol-phosphate synthase subunit HisH
MSTQRVVIVDTGVANTASVIAALERCGASTVVTDERAPIEDAMALVLPGVGSFGAGMERLERCDLIEPLVSRIEADRPTLAVCLGLQLLARSSDETPGVPGLGVIDAHVGVFPVGVRTPQFGWNRVEADGACVSLASGYAYFANSYRIDAPPEGWSVASSEHGGRFVAGLERGRVVACQFHPELSGALGLSIIERWLASAREGARC